jgi:hypothetical protein
LYRYPLIDGTAATERGTQQVAIEAADEVQTDFFGAGCRTFPNVGAATKAFGIHLGDHFEYPLLTLGLPLGQ